MEQERLRRLIWGLPIVGGLLLAGGCNRALFPEDVPRSPYERYMALRGEYRPKNEQSAFGREQPALRQRLAPLR